MDIGDGHGIYYSSVLNRGRYVSIFSLFTARRVCLINEASPKKQDVDCCHEVSRCVGFEPGVALEVNLNGLPHCLSLIHI